MLRIYSHPNPIMPLLMGFTPTTPIETGTVDESYTYDDTKQITIYMMPRVVGTKSLKSHSTQVSSSSYKTDKKNEIDDSKTVK